MGRSRKMSRPLPRNIAKKPIPVPAKQVDSSPDSAQINLTHSQQLSYYSPIPPPTILAGYNAIVSPDAADRILKMVEKQEDHRQYLEKLVIQGDNRRAYMGLVAGCLILLAILAASVYMVLLGQAIAGITAFVMGLSTFASVFFYGTKNRKEERAERGKLLLSKQPAEDSEAKKLAK